MDAHKDGLRIAVIGSGVSGLTAAHLLDKHHDVTLFEKNDYLGGHTHTIVLPDGPDAGTPVDTGFIVCNPRNYPLFLRLLASLGVKLRDSDMSFGYYDAVTGLQYSGSDINGLFAQRSNLLRPRFWKMIREVLRFFETARRDLASGALEGKTFGEYLRDGRFDRAFIDDHILPMGAAIWSTPPDRMLDFPAESFIRFFENHGLLSLRNRPQWRTVEGGSHTYVKRIEERFRGTIRLSSRIAAVRREDGAVKIDFEDGPAERFDRVVLAAHADESLALLADPDEDEKRLLGAWRYTPNRTMLHASEAAMPPNRRAWSSWNYTREQADGGASSVSLTYHMNRLQGLATAREYFVTLNRADPIPPDRILADLMYTHPTYTFDSLATQPELERLNGRRNTFFAGSYFGYGFHEDGVRSGVNVARAFGIEFEDGPA